MIDDFIEIAPGTFILKKEKYEEIKKFKLITRNRCSIYESKNIKNLK